MFIFNFLFSFFFAFYCYAYPIFAQNLNLNPISSSGQIVCSQCHLGDAFINVLSPSVFLKESLFEVRFATSIPQYRLQFSSDLKSTQLQRGGILICPTGFQLSNFVFSQKNNIIPYNSFYSYVFVVGPVSNQTQIFQFPIISSKTFGVGFLYAGLNVGRGQVFPNGLVSNSQQIQTFCNNDKKQFQINVNTKNQTKSVDRVSILARCSNSVYRFDVLPYGQVSFSNVSQIQKLPGGFAQSEVLFLRSTLNRFCSLLVFNFITWFAILLLVLKKKQFERFIENTYKLETNLVLCGETVNTFNLGLNSCWFKSNQRNCYNGGK